MQLHSFLLFLWVLVCRTREASHAHVGKPLVDVHWPPSSFNDPNTNFSYIESVCTPRTSSIIFFCKPLDLPSYLVQYLVLHFCLPSCSCVVPNLFANPWITSPHSSGRVGLVEPKRQVAFSHV